MLVIRNSSQYQGQGSVAISVQCTQGNRLRQWEKHENNILLLYSESQPHTVSFAFSRCSSRPELLERQLECQDSDCPIRHQTSGSRPYHCARDDASGPRCVCSVVICGRAFTEGLST